MTVRSTAFVNGHEFMLIATLIGEAKGFPYGGDKAMHYKWYISVGTPFRPPFRFTYYTSAHDWNNKKMIDSRGVRTAFYHFMGDVQAGLMDYESFVSEFGYDQYDKNSKRVYNAVRKSAEKWDRSGLGDIYAYINDFQEKYPDDI